ncbi:hypothetical protein Bca4012_026274 [Brassica carinata]
MAPSFEQRNQTAPTPVTTTAKMTTQMKEPTDEHTSTLRRSDELTHQDKLDTARWRNTNMFRHQRLLQVMPTTNPGQNSTRNLCRPLEELEEEQRKIEIKKP